MNYDTSSQFENKEFKEILNTYEESVRNKSSVYLDADKFIDIAQYYIENNREEEAQQAYDMGLSIHPNNTDILVSKAYNTIPNGDLEKAYQIYDLIEDKDNRDVKNLKALLLIVGNRLEEGDRIFEEIAEEDNYSVDTLTETLANYIDLEIEDLASKWLNVIREKGYDYTKNERLTEVLSNYYLTFDDYDQAIPLLKRLIDKHPYTINYWIELANCYVKESRFAEADEALDYALAINDKEPSVLELKGGCSFEKNDYQKAEEYYLRLEQVDPNKPKVWYYLAKVYSNMGRKDKTVEYSFKIVDSEDASDYIRSLAYHDLASIFGYAHRFKKGLDFIEKAIKLNKNNPTFYVTKGCLQILRREKNQGRKSFIKAIHTIHKGNKEEEFSIWMMIATSFFDAEMYNDAIKIFEKIEKKYADKDQNCYLFLAYCNYRIKNFLNCTHYLALLKNTAPQLYDQLGTDNDPIGDPNFSESVSSIKRDVALGKIDLSTFEDMNNLWNQ